MASIDYWHERHDIPEETKQKLREFVRGEFVEWLYPEDYKAVALYKVNSEVFHRAFAINREFLFRGDYTAPPEENSYGDDECYLTEDGLAGFSVTERNWLVSLYSNQSWNGFLDMITPLLQRVNKLVCIVNDTNDDLIHVYKKVLGFRIIAHTVDDTQIMTEYYGREFMDNFVQNYGHPHHVFMYRPGTEKEFKEVRSFDDYFEAEAYVDQMVM